MAEKKRKGTYLSRQKKKRKKEVYADCRALAPARLKVSVKIRAISNDAGEALSILSGIISRLDRNTPEYKVFNTYYLAVPLLTSIDTLSRSSLIFSAHFIDSKSSIQQRLLALREQQGAHTGLNVALTLAEIASDWEIIDRIGCLVSDNASNNDVCGEEFFRRILPGFLVEDASDRRIRCYGHILNLVGRAFLYGEDFESFE
ncbi:hypothetical protein QBC46DRAFT_411112 [Diplogelasinospora grovesii]|uniref:Uncharacterized protein n=1 Tax=Diplogelasinospora grovesii TaxID=303347 RepID=A0AAN6S2J3_9PEZI|nr:hypothetical protein QBC46DRAFT_411112 [Diplogelasinospora grovesii]